MQQREAQTDRTRRVIAWLKSNSLLIALLAVATCLAFFRLGVHALIDNDEATYARVLRESLARGEHFAFWLSGKPWFEKPPLYFWMMGLSVKVFGGLNEFSMRLPSAVAYVVCILLTWLIAFERTKDRLTAALAATVLMTTGFFLYAGRQVRMDVPVIAAILLGVWCMMRGLKKEKWLLGVGISAGIGVLLKSVIGLLVYPFVVIYALFEREKAWLKNRWFWLGNLAGLAIAAPWHIYMTLRFGGTFWSQYLGYQIVRRVFDRVTLGTAGNAFTYMITYIFSNSTPWLYLAVILGVYAVIRWRSSRNSGRSSIPFFAIGFFVIVLFLIPKTKLPYYFLPAFPFIAAAVAMEMRLLLRRFPQFTSVVVAILLAIGAVFTGFKVFSLSTYNALMEKTNVVSEAMSANIERTAGKVWAKEDSPLVVYAWPLFETNTVRYYGNHEENPIVTVGMNTIDNFKDIKLGDYTHFLMLVPSALRPPDPDQTPEFIKGFKTKTVYFDKLITMYEVSKE